MKWKTEYATGVRHIDRQHQELVKIITLFETISRDKSRWNDAHRLILRTKRFLEFHFSAEEFAIRRLPSDERDAHRAEHQRELQHIADIEHGMLNGFIRDSLAPQMRHCLFGHILETNRWIEQYADGLLERRLPGKSRNSAAVAAHCR